MSIKTGKFERTETLTDPGPYGGEYRHSKKIEIEKRTYSGKTVLRQTETTYRDSVMTYRADYPASTEYAKERRAWVCDF